MTICGISSEGGGGHGASTASAGNAGAVMWFTINRRRGFESLIAHALSSLKVRYCFQWRLSPRGSPGHRQGLDAMKELREQSRRFAGHRDVGDFAAQFVEDAPDLATSQVGAQAEM